MKVASKCKKNWIQDHMKHFIFEMFRLCTKSNAVV